MGKAVWALTAVVVFVGVAWADWPQFQGPNRDGVSTETVKLADTWPEGGPKVAWKIEWTLGTGYGGPVVEGGKVYLLDRVNDRQDVLRCIGLASGKEEWKYEYFAPAEAKDDPAAGKWKGGYGGSRNLPTVDATGIYILGPFGDLTCVSKETHQAVWTRNLMKEYGAILGNWGICQSPVLYKGTVIVAPLSKEAGIVAFDKASGKEVWKSERLGGPAWTSPFISTVDGVDQVVMLFDRGEPRLVGLDAATGRKLWQYNGWKCPNPVASQTDCGQGRFFITGGYKAGCVMVQAAKDGDAWKVQELFKNLNCGAQACKPVFYKGHIYANSGDFTNADATAGNGLMCLDLAGAIKWKTSNDNIEENGSVLIADGKIFSLLSEKGVLRLVQAAPDGYKELASAKVCQAGNTWAPMALAGGKLLIRSRRSIFCFDVAAEAKPAEK
jgi:outer membrane protein assembly factor BamB